MDNKSDTDTEKKEKRLDLSVPQVAGSALAAAVAAFLAGQLGVYGTIIGAGVVSVVATTGGSIFQHLFRRTGEQLKEAATVGTRPKPRRSRASRGPQRGGTGMVLPTFDRQGAEDEITSVAAKGEAPDGTDRTQLLPQADETQVLGRAGAGGGPADKTQLVPRLDDRTMAFGQARPGHPAAGATAVPAGAEEVSTATYGTRLRGWKRPALGALAIFVLSLGAVTCVELVNGHDASGNEGTSVTNVFRSGGHKSEDRTPPATDTPSPGTSHGNGSSGGTPTPGPSGSTGTGGDRTSGGTDGRPTPNPSPDASKSGKPTPPPSPKPNPSKSGGGDGGGSGKGGDDSKGGSGGQNEQQPGGQQVPDPKSS
ncbi:hypothetical protein ACH4OW_31155 [Streptomyces sp. NPDC017056]|uniref:hypothetical protein n=1 Tax=Streptomyces sp. NPDC017056 TaxID=3364973 RepID=UPI0037A1D615